MNKVDTLINNNFTSHLTNLNEVSRHLFHKYVINNIEFKTEPSGLLLK